MQPTYSMARSPVTIHTDGARLVSMLTDTNATMIEALRLTQAGQLTEASSLLQRDLGGAPGGGLQGAMADLPGIGSTRLPGRAPSPRSGAAARAAAAPGGGRPPPPHHPPGRA